MLRVRSETSVVVALVNNGNSSRGAQVHIMNIRLTFEKISLCLARSLKRKSICEEEVVDAFFFHFSEKKSFVLQNHDD